MTECYLTAHILKLFLIPGILYIIGAYNISYGINRFQPLRYDRKKSDQIGYLCNNRRKIRLIQSNVSNPYNFPVCHPCGKCKAENLKYLKRHPADRRKICLYHVKFQAFFGNLIKLHSHLFCLLLFKGMRPHHRNHFYHLHNFGRRFFHLTPETAIVVLYLPFKDDYQKYSDRHGQYIKQKNDRTSRQNNSKGHNYIQHSCQYRQK